MVTKKQIEKMQKLLDRKVPVIQIAREVGVSYTTARKYCASQQSSQEPVEKAPTPHIPVVVTPAVVETKEEFTVEEEVAVPDAIHVEEETIPVEVEQEKAEDVPPVAEKIVPAPANAAPKTLTLSQYIKTFIGNVFNYQVNMNYDVEITDGAGNTVHTNRSELREIIHELEELDSIM